VPGDGRGQTIAIVDAYHDPSISAEADMFDQLNTVSQFDSRSLFAAYGPSSKWLTVDNPQNATLLNPVWAGETALDVEWAHAIAPGARILLVEAKSASKADMLGAVSFAAKQPGVVAVSMSFGAPEFASETLFDSLFNSQNGKGITFVAATGDSVGVKYP